MERISKDIQLTRKDIAISVTILAAFFAACFTAFFFGFGFLGKAPDFGGAEISATALYTVSAAIFLLIPCFVFLSFWAFMRKGLKQHRLLLLACLLLFLTYAGCILAWNITQYALPICVAAIVAAHLLDTRLGFVFNVVSVLLVIHFAAAADLAGKTTEGFASIILPATVNLLFGCILAFQVGQNVPRLQFIGRILLNAAAVLPLIILFILLADPAGENILLKTGIGFLMQIAFPLILIPIFEFMFNLPTNNRFIVLSDYKQPLLARLASETPATFNHSQIVGNFAESCAGAIGENVYLARAAAMYHDIGKLANAEYYTENQTGINPHDNLPPELSAAIIRKHAEDGYEMVRANGVPEEIAAICLEHHGTMPITSFVSKAQRITDVDSELDMDLYRYRGPVPSSKIAAIVMICDCSEAAIRSIKTNDRKLIDDMVQKNIHERINAGQFDNCGITLQELAIIRQILVDFSTGVYHKRIEYPKQPPPRTEQLTILNDK